MKKLIFGLGLIALVISSSAFADGRHGDGHRGRGYDGGHWARGHGDGWMWVVPAIVGGVIVYEATREPPSQTIIIQQPVEPNCSPWTEIQNPDGTITRTRTCNK